MRCLTEEPHIDWETHYFPHRRKRILKLLVDRIYQLMARLIFWLTGHPLAVALSTSAVGLEGHLRRIDADAYFAHNIDTLLPACRIARRLGKIVLFDSMEFHSEMGESQTSLEKRIIRKIESICLPRCALVFAASDGIAGALAQAYGIARPITLWNMPPVMSDLASKNLEGLMLYWRNSVIGLGQRGLDDALTALGSLPADVTLHLQGRLPVDGLHAVKTRIKDLGIGDRVIIHPPYPPDSAVREASKYSIGLCLERPGIRNHELTVSNKMFDYHMAGLAIVASDLPSLRAIVEESGAGITFKAGSADSLAAAISKLYNDRRVLKQMQQNARIFALREGNREREMGKLTANLTKLFPQLETVQRLGRGAVASVR